MRRSAWPLAVLLAAVLGLAAGRLLPAAAPGEGSPEVAFARDMTAHHAQAVEMALAALERSRDPQLRTLAVDIALTQQAQIGAMSTWLETWGRPFAGLTPPMGGRGQEMGMASQADVNALRTLPLPEAEISFLRLMIRHHRGGVAMAEAALTTAREPEVRRLAAGVVAGQRAEVNLMAGMLERRGAEPPPEEPMDMDHGSHGSAGR